MTDRDRFSSRDASAPRTPIAGPSTSAPGWHTLPPVFRAQPHTADLRALLRSMHLLSSLPDDTIGTLAEGLVVSFPRDALLLEQGDPSDTVLIILRGLVGIHQTMPFSSEPTLLGVLAQGDTLGEAGALCGTPRSATLVALTDVDVLVLSADDFLALLGEHGPLCLEVARAMARRLLAVNARLGESAARVVVIVSRELEAAGVALARLLHDQNGRPTGLTCWDEPDLCPDRLGLPPSQRSIRHHPDGFQVVVHRAPPNATPGVHASLVLDMLRQRYPNTVILVSPEAAAGPGRCFVEEADLLVLGDDATDRAAYARGGRQPAIRLGRRDDADVAGPGATRIDGAADAFRDPDQDEGPASDPWAEAAEQLAARLGRDTRIAAYIPRYRTDGSLATGAVEATLALFARLFGGATREDVRGVWLGAADTLVDDEVCIVRSFTTASALRTHITAVIAHLEQLKLELAQDAMGLDAAGQWILV